MSSPGADTSTQGPPRLNLDGCPSGPIEPTVRTRSLYHAGLTVSSTESQSGVLGRAGSGGGFWLLHCPSPTFPAATTTTTFLTSTAYCRAAPSGRSSRNCLAEAQATSEMLMTVAPMSAAVRTAIARVSTLPTPLILEGSSRSFPPLFFTANFALD
ncbi:Uncharacterised protein [Mycobacteroides abscessus subsp. abscessus]|nr:Uncharacterised protein [Mycobacteroides abscessus subsp. abscessus]